MNCPSCQRENRSEAVFCSGCGERLSVICDSCGRSNPPDGSFCDGCGTRLADSTAVAPAPQRDPHSYTPKHLADKILQSRSALEGERKQVTVLFADVKGSMELAEQVDPEEWHGILDRFFEILADGIHRFEGTVNQYTGDGIMALFGAPIAHEDHAQRACYAALHLSDELEGYARELKRDRGLIFSVRIGLNSGEVVVGKIGNDLRMDYTAQGHTVGLAERMEQLASPGRTYLTEQTQRLVTGYVELEDLGAFTVPGARNRLHVFELRGLGEHRTRLDVARARGLTRFVGRTREMGTLDEALERSVAGNAQVVGVVADAGVGKSRLCFQFIERCRARGIRVSEGHGVSHGKTMPLLPILEQLRSAMGIADRDDDERVRQKIAGALVLLGEELEGSLPLIFELFGVPDPQRPAPQLDPETGQAQPETRQARVFAVLRRIFQARSHSHPAVILLEDLHWFDPASIAFLEGMIDAVQGTRTLLLLTFRPEFHADWIGKSYYQQLSLQLLGADAIDELLGDLLGRDPSLSGLSARIFERTGGNPFFAEEVVNEFAESGLLEGNKGAHRLTGPVEGIAIPPSVQALLASRIDRLAEREKQVLQTAAVIGREFAEPILREVAEVPDAELGFALEQLRSGEFIHEAELYPQRIFVFKHALTQEVADQSQLAQRRRHIHERIARAIESTDPSAAPEKAARLAHHWEEAGRALEAAHCHLQAADKLELSDVEEGLRRWQRVCELLETIPDTPETMRMELKACRRIVESARGAGRSPDEARSAYERGRALAERLGDRHALVSIMSFFGVHQSLAGQREQSSELMKAALSLAEATGDPHLQADAAASFGNELTARGAFEELLGLVSRALDALERSGSRPTEVWGRMLLWKILSSLFLGRVGEARLLIEDGRALMREHGLQLHFCCFSATLAFLAEMTGSWEGIPDRTREATSVADRFTTPYTRAYAYDYHGWACLHVGALEEARTALHHALDITREWRSGMQIQVRILTHVSAFHLAVRELESAERFAAETVSRFRAPGRVNPDSPAHIALANALLQAHGLKRRDDIQSELTRAAELLEPSDAQYPRHALHLARADFAQLLDDPEARDRELRAARQLLATWGNQAEVERIDRELGA